MIQKKLLNESICKQTYAIWDKNKYKILEEVVNLKGNILKGSTGDNNKRTNTKGIERQKKKKLDDR